LNINKLISIIIPNYNNEKYLKKCLDSCINQTYKNLEIVIVDDCSRDNSVNIIKEYQKNDNRIKLIENKSNQKVSKTRHIGIESSNGEWITTLDSDDFYYSDEKIESEMIILSNYNFDKSVIAFSKTVRVDSSGKNILSIMDENTIKEGKIFDFLISRSCPAPRDFIFSKDLYINSGGYDFTIPIYEDWDLKLRLSKLAKYYLSSSYGTAYRQHNSGLSSAKKAYHNEWISKIFSKNTLKMDSIQVGNFKSTLQKNINPSVFFRVTRKIKNLVGLK
jgi:glycosyltransferase involved in cell wall biosynthesis